MAQKLAIKRYDRTVLGLSVVYAALLIAVTLLFNRHMLSGAVAYIAALLPALPILGIFAAVGRYLNDERDEYVRMLMVRQSLIATAFALSIATIWGFLESFGLVAHVDAYFVAVLWFGGLGLGSCVNRLVGG